MKSYALDWIGVKLEEPPTWKKVSYNGANPHILKTLYGFSTFEQTFERGQISEIWPGCILFGVSFRFEFVRADSLILYEPWLQMILEQIQAGWVL